MFSFKFRLFYKITQRWVLGIVTETPEFIVIGPTEEAFLPVGNV
jgi:hypothetical protein